jgi:hypothetical protein
MGLVIDQTITNKERRDWGERLSDPETWLRLRESAELMLERLGYATVRGANRPDLDSLELELTVANDLLKQIYVELSYGRGLNSATHAELKAWHRA